jgi:hypothetical protein
VIAACLLTFPLRLALPVLLTSAPKYACLLLALLRIPPLVVLAERQPPAPLLLLLLLLLLLCVLAGRSCLAA